MNNYPAINNELENLDSVVMLYKNPDGFYVASLDILECYGESINEALNKLEKALYDIQTGSGL